LRGRNTIHYWGRGTTYSGSWWSRVGWTICCRWNTTVRWSLVRWTTCGWCSSIRTTSDRWSRMRGTISGRTTHSSRSVEGWSNWWSERTCSTRRTNRSLAWWSNRQTSWRSSWWLESYRGPKTMTWTTIHGPWRAKIWSRDRWRSTRSWGTWRTQLRSWRTKLRSRRTKLMMPRRTQLRSRWTYWVTGRPRTRHCFTFTVEICLL